MLKKVKEIWTKNFLCFLLKKSEKILCPNFFYFFEQKFFLGFLSQKIRKISSEFIMQIQCIRIRGDFENTFCLYMRLLRFDVQLLFLKKKRTEISMNPVILNKKCFFWGGGGRGTISVFGSYIPNLYTLSSFFAIRAFSVIINLQNRSNFNHSSTN